MARTFARRSRLGALTSRRVQPALGRALLLSMVIASGCGGPSSGFTDANGIRAEIEAAKSALPLPPQGRYTPITLTDGDSYQVGSGTTMVQYQAACAWFDAWAKAISGGDTEGQERATDMADTILTWDVYRTSDPSNKKYWTDIIEAARLGDASGLISQVVVNCG